MKTLAQFEHDRMLEVCAEYSISQAHFKTIYEAGSFRLEWVEYLEAEAKAGKQFPKPVCRSISDNGGSLTLWQKFFRCIPGDVLLADGRTL